MKDPVVRIRVLRIFMNGGAVLIPGLPSFANSVGSSIYFLETWFALGMLLTLVSSGLAATKLGDRCIVCIGASLLMIGAASYFLAYTEALCIFAECCIGGGLGCIMGSDESLLFSATRARKGAVSAYAQQWSHIIMLQIVFVAACFYLGGVAYQLHPRLPFVLAFCSYAVVLYVAASLPPIESAASFASLSQMIGVLRASTSLCWLIAVYACFLAIVRVSFWGLERFFVEANMFVSHGTAISIGALLSAILLLVVHRIRNALSVRLLTILLGLAIALSLLAMGFFVAPWCIILVCTLQVASGLVQSSIASELHEHINENDEPLRAAISSLRQSVFLLSYLVVIATVHAIESMQMAEIMIRLGAYGLITALLLVVISYAVPGLDKRAPG